VHGRGQDKGKGRGKRALFDDLESIPVGMNSGGNRKGDERTHTRPSRLFAGGSEGEEDVKGNPVLK